MKAYRIAFCIGVLAVVDCGSRTDLGLLPPSAVERPAACSSPLQAGKPCAAAPHEPTSHDAGPQGPQGTSPTVGGSSNGGSSAAGSSSGGSSAAGSNNAGSAGTGGETTSVSCGDGILDPGEDCDLGLNNGTVCSAQCREQQVLNLATGGGRSCAVLSHGVVKCWGYVAFGFLGLGDTTSRGDLPNEMGDNLPAIELGSGRSASAITLGDYHTCALLDGGSVKCWGANGTGQLGLGDTDIRGLAPNEMGDHLPSVDLGTGKIAVTVSAGNSYTCAVLNGGSVKCWGANDKGQLGLGDTQSRGSTPGQMGDQLPAVDLGTGKRALAVSAGSGSASYYDHTCALLNGGSVKCWGANDAGQLGLGDTATRGSAPGQMGDHLPTVDLGAGKTALAVSAGYEYTCALLQGGSVKCWGVGGELGLGDTLSRGSGPNQMGDNLPTVDFGAGKTATAVAAGYGGACAILNDGSLKCWGLNYNGQLGLGDTVTRGDKANQMGSQLPAVDLGTGRTVAQVAAGNGASGGGVVICAILDDHSVKCWGAGGSLGLGDLLSRGDKPNEMGDNLPRVKLFSSTW